MARLRWLVPWAWLSLPVVLAVLWARRAVVLVTVEGGSMAPTFEPGDRVVVHRCRVGSLAIGDVIVTEAPDESRCSEPPPRLDSRLRDRHWYVKRVAALPGDTVPAEVLDATSRVRTVPPGCVVLLGDNPRSYDSRAWGFFPLDRVLGRVKTRLVAAGNRGQLS